MTCPYRRRAHRGIALSHGALYRDRAAQRINDAGEFNEHPIAGGFYDTTRMLSDFRIDKLGGSAFSARACPPSAPPFTAGPKDVMGRAAKKWQLRRCIFSMECRDAPAE